MRAGIKAGLIFGVIFIIITLPSILTRIWPDSPLVPLVGFLNCCLFFTVYPGTGILASYLLPPPRTPGSSAQEGAIAGVVAIVLQGSFATLVNLIFVAIGFEQPVPPETQAMLEEIGVEFLLTPTGQLLAGCVGILWSMILAVGIGSISGALHAVIQKD